MPPAPLATPQEVADYLRKSTGTLANWRALGIGPPYRKTGNGSVLYDWPDVERWLADSAAPAGRTA